MTTINQVQISNQFFYGSDFVCIDFCDQLLTENSDYTERNFHTQNLNDLTALGIENNSDLIKVFDKAFYQGDIIKTTTSKFGTTVVKGAQVGENGAIHVGFFYEGGNMTATPKVSSIIPKLAPKK